MFRASFEHLELRRMPILPLGLQEIMLCPIQESNGNSSHHSKSEQAACVNVHNHERLVGAPEHCRVCVWTTAVVFARL